METVFTFVFHAIHFSVLITQNHCPISSIQQLLHSPLPLSCVCSTGRLFHAFHNLSGDTDLRMNPHSLKGFCLSQFNCDLQMDFY